MHNSLIAPRDLDSGWSAYATRFLLALFAVELVLGGPGYWQFAGVSVRRSLVALVTGWLLLLCIVGKCRLRLGHIELLASIASLMTIWILLIPSLQGSKLVSDGIQEGFPLALLFTGVLAHAYYRDNPSAWFVLRRVTARALAAAAVLALAVWLVGTFVISDPILVAIGFANYFTLGNDELQPSLYVQVMPDGFFRVMWITSTLFIVGLLYSLNSGRRLAAALFAAALFVSYTRALWLSAALGILYVFARNTLQGRSVRFRPALAVLVVAAVTALVTIDIVQNGEESITLRAASRLLTTFSDESASDRVDQVQPLLDAWLASPVFGSGMGSAASVSRSDVAPYLYELTYLALLMKMGVIGLLVVAVLIGSLLTRATPRQASVAHVEASILSFLLACSSNPYLLNLVGLGLLCFLFIDRDMLARHTSANRPARRSGGLTHNCSPAVARPSSSQGPMKKAIS